MVRGFPVWGSCRRSRLKRIKKQDLYDLSIDLYRLAKLATFPKGESTEGESAEAATRHPVWESAGRGDKLKSIFIAGAHPREYKKILFLRRN